ncbi:MAG: hypothetical protein KAH48_09120, partial [Chlorobi bacterium]|nr:hypothetical protein [Chlorobiota bacterium]
FESGKTFAHSYPDEKTFIPGLKENEELVIALSGSFAPVQWGTNKRAADFYDIKGVSEDLFAEFRYENIKTKANKNEHPILSKNSLMIVNKKEKIGYLGEVKKSILKMYDIDNPVYMMVLNLSAFYQIAAKHSYFSAVAPFPGITRDLAFVCDKDSGAEAVRNEIMQNGGKLLKAVTLFDVYEGKSVGSGKKSLAFAVEFASSERTLVDEDAEKSVEKIIKAIERKFKAVLR